MFLTNAEVPPLKKKWHYRCDRCGRIGNKDPYINKCHIERVSFKAKVCNALLGYRLIA